MVDASPTDATTALIKKYGFGAISYAAAQARGLELQGDKKGAEAWRAVMFHVADLLSPSGRLH